MPLPPLTSVDVHGAAWFDHAELLPAPAGGLRAGVLFGGHFEFGMTAEAGAGPGARAALDARWLHADVATGAPSAWIGVTGGAKVLPSFSPGVGPTVGIELPLGPLLGRVGADVQFGEETLAAITLGVGWRKRPPEPPPPEPPPVVPPPSGIRVWIPHPWCEWVPIESAGPLLDQLPPGTPVRVSAPGFVPAEVDAGAASTAKLVEIPPQGGLTVAGAPGDAVVIGERAMSFGSSAHTSSLAAEGPLSIEVTGGGRKVADRVVVTAGRALWVNLPLPSPLEVRFAVRDATLSEEARAALVDVAAKAGGWAFEVSGGASPEGDQARNQALATERAEATAKALVDAGIPADRVRIVAAHVPDPAAPLESQRVAVVTPVAP